MARKIIILLFFLTITVRADFTKEEGIMLYQVDFVLRIKELFQEIYQAIIFGLSLSEVKDQANDLISEIPGQLNPKQIQIYIYEL
ncbi:hypothetical protein ABER68_18595 [Paenibacillus alvei]